MQLARNARLVVSLTTLMVLIASPAATCRFPTYTVQLHLHSAAAQQNTDARERVRLPAVDRDAILAEMRTMLESLSGIMQGLVAGDLVIAEKAARAAGKVAAIDPSLEKKLPSEFFQLDTRTHKRFDGLADAIKTGATKDAVLRRLAAITATCTTCHARYRLDETRE
jgi:cytochrome c556